LCRALGEGSEKKGVDEENYIVALLNAREQCDFRKSRNEIGFLTSLKMQSGKL
jgi:hypothetical protein